MQSSAATAVSLDAASRVASADGKVEGVQVGTQVVLFGRDGLVNLGAGGSTSYDITAGAGQVLTHHVVDLVPGAVYSLSGADRLQAIASPAGVIEFSSVGSGAIQNIQIMQITA
jgi:hypothetical protein